MRIITSYLGVIYAVPSWTSYIAADEDGMVMAHEVFPEKWAHEWSPVDLARWEVLFRPTVLIDNGWAEPKKI